MTYTPIKTVVNTKGVLHESDDITVPASYFLDKESYLVLEENKTQYVIDLSSVFLSERHLVYTQSVGEFLTTRLSDIFVTRHIRTDIPVLNERGAYNKRIKVFNPMEYKNHTVQFTSVNTPNIVDDMSRKGFLDDLVITARDDVTNYLACVNGVFHKTAISNNKLYVLDGFRTMRISAFKDVTIVDTSPLGGHDVIGLTDQNVTLDTYNGRAVITTASSLKDKTVFIVVDGYFYHAEADVIKIYDENTITVDVNKLSLIDQFRHNPRTIYRKDRLGEEASQRSRKYEDAYDALFLGKRSIPTSALQTRDFQYSRLTAYHSFLVVIDNPNVFAKAYDILPTGAPQFFRDHADRLLSGMMQYGVGHCPSYVILRDPFKRKSIYVQSQNYDVNIHHDIINPTFLPTLIPEIARSLTNPPRLIDYVSA